MKVLIIEDEKLAQEKMISYIKSFDRGVEIVETLDCVSDGIEFLSKTSDIDLIFADVELSDGTSFDIFNVVQPDCPTIFVTAYDKYAVKAFKTNSIDYILKPIKKEDLMAGMMKYYQIRSKETYLGKVSLNADSTLHQAPILQDKYKSRFLTRVGETFMFTPIEEIAYFNLEAAGTYLYTWNNHKQLIDHNLEQLEELLPPKLFFRINRSFIAHFNSIEKLIRYSNRRLKVEIKNYTGEDLVISREKSLRLRAWLDS